MTHYSISMFIGLSTASVLPATKYSNEKIYSLLKSNRLCLNSEFYLLENALDAK